MERGGTMVNGLREGRKGSKEGTTDRGRREEGVKVIFAIEAFPKLKSLFGSRRGELFSSAQRGGFERILRGDPKNHVEVKKETGDANFVLNSLKKAEGGRRSMHVGRMYKCMSQLIVPVASIS